MQVDLSPIFRPHAPQLEGSALAGRRPERPTSGPAPGLILENLPSTFKHSFLNIQHGGIAKMCFCVCVFKIF